MVVCQPPTLLIVPVLSDISSQFGFSISSVQYALIPSNNLSWFAKKGTAICNLPILFTL